MEDYRDRMRREYAQLTGRLGRLERMLDDVRAGTRTLSCSAPIELLEEQAEAMRAYQAVLRKRAEAEGVPLHSGPQD